MAIADGEARFGMQPPQTPVAHQLYDLEEQQLRQAETERPNAGDHVEIRELRCRHGLPGYPDRDRDEGQLAGMPRRISDYPLLHRDQMHSRGPKCLGKGLGWRDGAGMDAAVAAAAPFF